MAVYAYKQKGRFEIRLCLPKRHPVKPVWLSQKSLSAVSRLLTGLIRSGHSHTNDSEQTASDRGLSIPRQVSPARPGQGQPPAGARGPLPNREPATEDRYSRRGSAERNHQASTRGRERCYHSNEGGGPAAPFSPAPQHHLTVRTAQSEVSQPPEGAGAPPLGPT